MTAPSAPPAVAPAASSYVARVERSGPATITGFVYDPADLAVRPVVELSIDGLPVALARAEIYRPDLEAAGIGDGRYGFSFALAPEAVSGGGLVQVGLANRPGALAPPIPLDRPAAAGGRPDGEAGSVAWRGGLQVGGWLAPGRDPARLRARAWIDGEPIAEVRPDRWHRRGTDTPAPVFLLHLPERFATGRTQQVTVTDGAGTPLTGSPLTLVAFPDPLEALATRAYGPDAGPHAARARLFDTLLPRALPFDQLGSWLQHYPPPGIPGEAGRVAVAIVGDAPADVARTRDGLGDARGRSRPMAALPSPDRLGFAPADLLAFVEGAAAGCDGLLLIPAGTILQPGACARLAGTLAADRAARLVYGDVALGPPDRPTVLAFPSFDYERWLEQGYGALLFALRPQDAAVAARAGADSLYRLANAQFDHLDDARGAIVHLPGLAGTVPDLDLTAATGRLAAATQRHLAARAMPAEVRPGRGTVLPAVRVLRRAGDAPVSVIVPTRGRPERLGRCLAAIRAALDRARAELVVVHDGASDPATETLRDAVRAAGGSLLAEPGPFNPARLVNRAVAAARGALACLLDDAVEARDAAWLDELLGRMREPSTAAAGAVLRAADGLVQHGGLVLGPHFAASPALTDRMADEAGYGDLLRVASEPSAVSTACLLVRRDAFQAVGGLDARHFPIHFGAVDLCLRVCLGS